MNLERTLQRVWYERSPLLLFLALLPLSMLFGVIAALRRLAYRSGIARVVRVERPVIVVGNISVGGTGKTPFVIWLAQWLQSQQLQVGIVTRGYGGIATHWPQDVLPQSDPREVGDEAVLLAVRTNALVVAGPDRVAAARRCIARGAQIVVSDDGLQHYRLARDCEIAVIDAQRRVGNGWLLPAGPLREPPSRLMNVDLVVNTRRGNASEPQSDVGAVSVRHVLGDAVSIRSGEHRELESFATEPAYAIAGIGNPSAFFAMLLERGVKVVGRPLNDHAALTVADISFPGTAPILMTEKDAVKCGALANERHWAVRLDAQLGDADVATVVHTLKPVVTAARKH